MRTAITYCCWLTASALLVGEDIARKRCCSNRGTPSRVTSAGSQPTPCYTFDYQLLRRTVSINVLSVRMIAFVPAKFASSTTRVISSA